MESIISIIIIAVLLIAIILIKFKPSIYKVEDDFVISYLVYYSIKGTFGNTIRDYFVLFKINKI